MPPPSRSSASRAPAGAADAVWSPTPGRPLAFQWVLEDSLDLDDPVQMGLKDASGKPLPAPDVYDIDLEYNSAATVSALHAQGKKVICYFDVGVYETYRDDAAKFQALTPRIWGKADAGWNGSYWADIRRVDELAPIMKARMQACKDKGFDAVEPDEMTGWSNDSGFPLTYADQIRYNKAVAGWAHELGLSVGMKGDLEQAHDLAPYFDWNLTEECYQYRECTKVYNPADGRTYPGVQSFTQLGKAVWIAEYKPMAKRWSSICSDSRTLAPQHRPLPARAAQPGAVGCRARPPRPPSGDLRREHRSASGSADRCSLGEPRQQPVRDEAAHPELVRPAFGEGGQRGVLGVVEGIEVEVEPEQPLRDLRVALEHVRRPRRVAVAGQPAHRERLEDDAVHELGQRRQEREPAVGEQVRLAHHLAQRRHEREQVRDVPGMVDSTFKVSRNSPWNPASSAVVASLVTWRVHRGSSRCTRTLPQSGSRSRRCQGAGGPSSSDRDTYASGCVRAPAREASCSGE